MPFSAKGDLMGDIKNFQYLFLRCDLDEVRAWLKPRTSDPHDSLDRYESLGTCKMKDTNSLVLYMREWGQGNAVNSTVHVPVINRYTEGVSTTRLPELDATGMLATRITSLNAFFKVCPQAGGENYMHYGGVCVCVCLCVCVCVCVCVSWRTTHRKLYALCRCVRVCGVCERERQRERVCV
jgi:hypothetical protein